MSTIRLALLGPLWVTREQAVVALPIAKIQALLTYLAVTQTSHTREHLLALLWAESHPDAARKNLRNRLWQLRQLLGEELLVAAGDRLALAPSVVTDLATFEMGIQAQLHGDPPDTQALAALLDLWRGPLLDGIRLTEAPDFELWLTTERERLGQCYRQALTVLIKSYQQAGNWPQVLTWAQRGVAYDPWQESFHQSLMLAHAKQGARAEALRQYEQLQVLLRQNLSIDPLPETDALRSAILKNELTSPTAHTALAIDLPHAATTAYPAASVSQPFVGREAQLATLDLAWQQARQGQCRVVMMSGEMGIGKTSLWQTWAATLGPEAVVLETRALNTTQTLPFDPVRRLLSSARCRLHFGKVAGELPPLLRAELLQLAPSLHQGESLPDRRQLTAMATIPTAERGLLAEALTQFFTTFGATPLIFFVDDLHWADSATLDWLLYLTDRMATTPLLLVGAYRPADAPLALTRLIGQWQRYDALQRMPLPSLTKAETLALLTALERDVTLADDLHQQSGGNPYYLTQLRTLAADGIPASLADLIQSRLRELAEPLLPMVQAAAILEPAIDLVILGQTSGRGEEETIDALDGLLAAGLLRERGELYEFTHPLVASVVREQLSNGRRKLLHRRAAEGIAARYAAQLPTVAGQLARHYAEAGVQVEAARFAEMAGDEALRVGAATEAVAFYQQAFAFAPTPSRQLGLGRALYFLPGQIGAARTFIQGAMEAYAAQQDCRGAIRANLYLAGSYLATGEGAQVLYWAQQILPDLETVEDPIFHASAHYLLGTAKFRNGYSMQEAAAHYAEATRLAAAHNLDEIGLMSWFEWGNLDLEAGDYPQAVAKFQQAQQWARANASIQFEALSLNNLAYATLLTGAVAEARLLIEQGRALAEACVLLPAKQYFYSTCGEIALAAGELTEATTYFEQALGFAEEHGNATFVANVQAHLGRAAQARGALAEAQRWLTTAKAGVTGTTALYLQNQIDLWLAELHLQRGDHTAAEASLQLAEERLAGSQYRMLQEKLTTLRASIP
ncbi:MAG: AAA family ATPase [Caldilineaceae bacterium]|nr:AAA family ATPase [Caldilineaceae bacterium]